MAPSFGVIRTSSTSTMTPSFGVNRALSTSTLLPAIQGRGVGLFERPSKQAPLSLEPGRSSLSVLPSKLFTPADAAASRMNASKSVSRLAANGAVVGRSAAAVDCFVRIAPGIEVGASGSSTGRSPTVLAANIWQGVAPLLPFAHDAPRGGEGLVDAAAGALSMGRRLNLPSSRQSRRAKIEPLQLLEGLTSKSFSASSTSFPNVSPHKKVTAEAASFAFQLGSLRTPTALAAQAEPLTAFDVLIPAGELAHNSSQTATPRSPESCSSMDGSPAADAGTNQYGGSSSSDSLLKSQDQATNCTSEPGLSRVDSCSSSATASADMFLSHDGDNEHDSSHEEDISGGHQNDQQAQSPSAAAVRKKRKRTTKKANTAVDFASKQNKEAATDAKQTGLGAVAGQRLYYVCQYGNNSPLVREIIRNREGWRPGPGDPNNMRGKVSREEKIVKVIVAEDLPEIQFLWTQYACPQFFDAMVSQQQGVCVTLNDETHLTLKQKKSCANPSEEGAESLATSSSASSPSLNEPLLPRVHNHMEGNGHLARKCGLRDTMMAYYLSHGRDPFGVLPLTLVITQCSRDPEYEKLCRCFEAIKEASDQCMWLVKPGEWANRGFGIKIYDKLDDITEHVESKEKTWVVQKYLERPLLVHRRKFDIRAYCLVNQDPGAGNINAFAYREAYLRTTSVEYTTETLDRMVHLNNDAVQSKGDDYGKFESANKLSLNEFQKYLDEHHRKDQIDVQTQIVPQIKGIMADTIRAAAHLLNPRQIDTCFEVYGFDFMVDEDYRVWLIEVNTNPCLEIPCTYLSQLIPKMLDEALQLSLDPLYPQAAASHPKKQTPDDTGLGGWERVFSGPPTASTASPSFGEVHCPWVPMLPEGQNTDNLDFAVLGDSVRIQERAEHFKQELTAMAARAPTQPARVERPSRFPRQSRLDAASKATEKSSRSSKKQLC